VAYDKHNW